MKIIKKKIILIHLKNLIILIKKILNYLNDNEIEFNYKIKFNKIGKNIIKIK